MSNSRGTVRQARPRQGLPFVMVPVHLIGTVSPMALAAYAAVSAYTNAETGTAWPGQARLADDLAVSKRTVQRALDELTAAGVLEVSARQHAVTRGRIQNEYRIVTPPTRARKR